MILTNSIWILLSIKAHYWSKKYFPCSLYSCTAFPLNLYFLGKPQSSLSNYFLGALNLLL